jgi:hypothetical protein
MSQIEGLTEREIIEENALYVLGMYDMYHNDREISDMLRMKGLNDHLVQEIMIRIKKPAWEKRVRQAKRLMLAGAALLIVFVGLPWLVIHFSNSGNSPEQQADQLIDRDGMVISSHRSGEGIFIVYFKFLLRIVLYVIILGVIQLAAGIYKFVKYKRLLRTAGQL